MTQFDRFCWAHVAMLVTGLLGFGVYGCLGDDEEKLPALVVPEMRGWLPAAGDGVVVQPFETFSFRAELTWPGGSNPGMYVRTSLEVNDPNHSEWSSPEEVSRVVRHEDDGVYVDIVPRWLGSRNIVYWLEVCNGPPDNDDRECAQLHPTEGVVFVAGGEARYLEAPAAEVRLQVGEQRPFQMVALADRPHPEQGVNLYTRSHEEVTCDTDDPSVATVDEQGLVTGVTEGETTLRCRAGEVENDVPVSVVGSGGDGLEEPDAGLHIVTDVTPIHDDYVVRIGADIHGVMAVDGRGWPRMILTLQPLAGPGRMDHVSTPQPTYLTRWTGSGFGFELIPPWFLNRMGWGGVGTVQTTLGPDDHEFVLWPYGVLDRPAGTPVGSWQERRLPIRPDLSMGSEDAERFRFESMEFENVLPKLTTLPDAEEGVWVAYSYGYATDLAGFSAETAGTYARDCVAGIRLAHVTADAIEVQDVAQYVLVDGLECTRYFDFVFDLPYTMHLLPPEPGARLPRILAADSSGGDWLEGEGARWLRARDGKWEEEPLPEVANSPSISELVAGEWIHHTVADAPGATPGWMLADEDGLGPVRELTVERSWPPPADPRVVAHSYSASPFANTMQGTRFAFSAQDGAAYIGYSTLGPLWLSGPDATLYVDDVIFPAIPSDHVVHDEHHTVVGYASTGERAYFLADRDPLDGVYDIALFAIDLPRVARRNADERDGQRIENQHTAMVPLHPVQVLPDGSRVLYYLPSYLNRNSVRGWLMRSPGAQGPWSEHVEVADIRPYEAVPIVVDDELWLVQWRSETNPLTVWRSADQGESWFIGAATDVNAAPVAARALPSGDVWILAYAEGGTDRYATLLHAPPHDGVPAFGRLPWGTESPVSSGGDADGYGLYSDGDEVVAVTASQELQGDGNRFLAVRRYSAGAELRWEGRASMDGLERCYPGHGGMGADGRIVLPCRLEDQPAQLPESWVYRVSDDGGATFTDADVDMTGWHVGSYHHPDEVVRLSDDRLLIAGTMDTGPDKAQAFYTVSQDGHTWSAPQLVRPEGGAHQRVYGVTPLPDGDALLLVGEYPGVRSGIVTSNPEHGRLEMLDWMVLRITP